MRRIQKHNIQNIKRYFERSTGVRLVNSLQDPAPKAQKRSRGRSFALIAAIASLSVLLVAFTWSIFSPADGDELTLSATYQGEGIVTIEVENHSHKPLEFQPQIKLYKWITDEQIPMMEDAVAYENLSIRPNSTEILTLDLSQAYDISKLESSLATEWYYLLLTNLNFSDGQTWKCSVHFGSEQLYHENNGEKLYEIDPAILSQIDEDLRFYFEDDYYNIFAGNPLHYKYLQKVQEKLQRSGKEMVGMVSPLLTLEPIKDGVILDENSDLERPYQLRSTWPTVHDEFGKLVGFTDDQHIKKVTVNTEDGWLFPIMYLATFEKEEILSDESCTFIYGQLISFGELEDKLVYDGERYCTYDVTHLFFTDLRSHFEEVVNMDPRYYKNAERYWDRIQNVYAYTKENLKIYTLEEHQDMRPYAGIEDTVSYKDMPTEGIYGILTCNFDMEKAVFRITAEDGTPVYEKTIIPDDPRRHDMGKEIEINNAIKNLDDGQYNIEVRVYVSGTEYMRCISAHGWLIDVGAVNEEQIINE